MTFALVGNQNCGKTTLFNALTGSNQHVGNFPGVTVDQKMGEMRDEKGCSVVDLPGIYSLRPYTQEEIVTRDFIINQKPDGIINIVDATNIERNLYLTLQLLELRVPMVLALNMMDEVRANGGSIDVQKMSSALGIPVVPIAAAKGEGVSELVDQAITVARRKVFPKVTDFCSETSAVHRCIHAVVHLIADHADRVFHRMAEMHKGKEFALDHVVDAHDHDQHDQRCAPHPAVQLVQKVDKCHLRSLTSLFFGLFRIRCLLEYAGLLLRIPVIPFDVSIVLSYSVKSIGVFCKIPQNAMDRLCDICLLS